jgi:hypothetical protein
VFVIGLPPPEFHMLVNVISSAGCVIFRLLFFFLDDRWVLYPEGQRYEIHGFWASSLGNSAQSVMTSPAAVAPVSHGA